MYARLLLDPLDNPTLSPPTVAAIANDVPLWLRTVDAFHTQADVDAFLRRVGFIRYLVAAGKLSG